MAKAKYERWLELDGLILIEGWARSGLTEEQIAHNMGINKKTLWVWKNDYAQIGNALKKGKEVADFEVENALYKSAMGFIGPDGKYYKPDITAQIFWLKNRRPDRWREKQITIENRTNDDGVEIINDAPG